jgi:beta-xylosidase
VLWEDLADNDVFRVNSTYYYTASNMHYSPGAPILRSYDLANWEYVGHAVPTLSFSAKYDLTNNQRAYVKGIFASTIRYRASNGLWYWIGCIEYSRTYIYTSPTPEGPWTQRANLAQCLYDCGLLVDDDDAMYVAYGNTQLYVARLAADGLSVANTQLVYSTPSSIGTLEGSRMYKRNGKYYVSVTRPANAQYVLQSSSPQGGYTIKVLANNMKSPVAKSGYPHQGSLIDTPSGQWYYMSFLDAYPGGRIPALAPITWGSDGFPAVVQSDGGWGASYPFTLPQRALAPTTGRDDFTGPALGPAWEWNHNPDASKFTVSSGLTLRAATVTTDLYAARNTLTHRIHGPVGVGTVALDFTSMADGDRCGLALLRDRSAWIGVMRDGSTYKVHVATGLNMNSDWTTQSNGSSVYNVAISGKKAVRICS